MVISMEMKKTLFKVLPYFASILAGFLFYLIGIKLSENFKGLFINISAAFFAIPFIYLFYQTAQKFSKKKLNKEIFDYAKMQIDREILSIVNQLSKIVYPLEERIMSLNGINNFLSIEKDDIKENISKKKYLGFQVFKKWEVSEDNLQGILKNSYILSSLEDEQIITIITLIKSLRYLEQIQKIEDLYIKTDKKATPFKIVSGKEPNEGNIKFPDRCVLLKNLSDNNFSVVDFGDFPQYDTDKLLQIFKVNEKHLEVYADAIFDLISDINNWINLTGGEFLIDTKMFRLGINSTVSIVNSLYT